MTDLLFDTPWWLPTAIIVLGVAVFISGNARQKLTVRNAGLGLVALAIVLMLVSYFVETDKEKCIRQTRETVKAVQDGDWTKFATLLDPRVTLNVYSGTIYANRGDLVKGAQDATMRYGLKSATIIGLDAKQTQTILTVEMNLFTVQDATMGRPVPSSWELQWQSDGKAWRLYQITCIKIGDLNLNQTRGMFP